MMEMCLVGEGKDYTPTLVNLDWHLAEHWLKRHYEGRMPQATTLHPYRGYVYLQGVHAGQRRAAPYRHTTQRDLERSTYR